MGDTLGHRVKDPGLCRATEDTEAGQQHGQMDFLENHPSNNRH